jgi:methyl-accepting chemotaxis protein
MQDTSARSVSAIQTISSRIHELDGVTATIAVAVEEQAAATRDIAGNVASAATGVGHVEAAVATIETLIGENRSAVGDLNAAADALVKQTQTIRERVKLFTGDIERLRA